MYESTLEHGSVLECLDVIYDGAICPLKFRSDIPFYEFQNLCNEVCPLFEIELSYCYPRSGAFKDGVVCFLYKNGEYVGKYMFKMYKRGERQLSDYQAEATVAKIASIITSWCKEVVQCVYTSRPSDSRISTDDLFRVKQLEVSIPQVIGIVAKVDGKSQKVHGFLEPFCEGVVRINDNHKYENSTPYVEYNFMNFVNHFTVVNSKEELLLYDCECGMKSKGTGGPNQPIEDEFPPLTILDPIIAGAERLSFPKALQGISSDFKASIKKHKEEQHQCNLFCQFVGLREYILGSETPAAEDETEKENVMQEDIPAHKEQENDVVKASKSNNLQELSRRRTRATALQEKETKKKNNDCDDSDSGDSGKSLKLSLDISEERSEEEWSEKLKEYNPKEAAAFAEKKKLAEASKKKSRNKRKPPKNKEVPRINNNNNNNMKYSL
eukprot:Nk52_evm1s2461 gene=Nk52_evmTU1s2461